MAEDAREKLEEILSGREYQAYEEQSEGVIQSFFARIEEWFVEMLADLLGTFGATGTGAAFGFVVLVAVAVVALAVILLMVSRRSKRQRAAGDEKPLGGFSEKNWTYRNHQDEAVKYEQAGDYTLASRHLFLALLLYFHEIEWLEAKSWKTNWEYYDELKRSDRQGADFFYKFVALFDHITYGEREVEKEEFEGYRSQAMSWLSRGQVATDDRRQEG